MTAYGLDPVVGFVVEPATIIKQQLDAAYKGLLGDSAGTDADGGIPAQSVAGQLIAIQTDGLAAQWDLQMLVYKAWDPTSATGASLDALCALSGTIREPATFSQIAAYCIGSPGTVLPAGRVARVTGTQARFATDVVLTIGAAVTAAWAQSTAYVLGDVVAANSNAYLCVEAGTSSNAGTGPAGTGAAIHDGTGDLHWNYIGVAASTGYVVGTFTSETVGPIGCGALDLSEIATPISGWVSVVNVVAATLGAYQETDAALRVRRDQELADGGRGTPNAIRAHVLLVGQSSAEAGDHVTYCTVYYNDSAATVDGLPPHSVEVVVLGGTNAAIGQAIFDSVAAGIETVSSGGTPVTVTVVDSAGNNQSVTFTRPTVTEIFVNATVYYDATQWTSGALVQQTAISAIVTYQAGGGFPPGRSVRSSILVGAILEGPSGVDSAGNALNPAPQTASAAVGLLDVAPCYIKANSGPAVAATPITIDAFHIANFDPLNITITATPEAP